jgi:hypothetical protein
MKVYDIEPRVAGKVWIGSSKRECVVTAGRVAEKGNSESLFFDGSDNFVVFEVGKRGSGKSYGMGSLLEAFATLEGSKISRHTSRRAVILLDPLDIHWTALQPLSDDGPEGLRKQHQLVTQWGDLDIEPIRVRVFVPAGYGWHQIDHPEFREYRIPVSSLTSADWALLLKADLIAEPRGRLIDEAVVKVTETGWNGRPAKTDYSIEDLIECIENDQDISGFYATETCRSVIQPFRALARMPLFESSTGTQMTELAEEGVLSVMSLGRLPEDLRTVLATVLVRKLRFDRMIASQIKRRLALSRESAEVRQTLEAELHRHVPRTILAIDEAQILMPARGYSIARQALDAYVLEGRNYGLSLWLATQRPKGAISDAAASQIDTFIVHRLSVSEDIVSVCGLLQNAQPDKIRVAGREIELPELIRSLDVGQAIFSSSSTNACRFVVANTRPRMVAHGGDAF